MVHHQGPEAGKCAAYRTKSTADVRGVLRALPLSGVLWVAGLFAITGTPPFGPFLSEFTVLRAAVDAGRPVVAITYLALLGLIFVGMAAAFLRMAHGRAPADLERTAGSREAWLSTAPPAVLAALVLLLGVYVPPALDSLLHEAARVIGGAG